MAIVIPRSLNEPVGLSPSNLSQTSAPTRSVSTGLWTRGVPPSSRVTTGVASVTGRNSRYSSIRPRQPGRAMPSGSENPQQRADPGDDVERAQFGQARLHVALPGGVGDEDHSGRTPAVGQAVLLHGPDRDSVATEDTGDPGQHAGTIDDFQVEV